MPALKNAKHERFAHGIVAGKSGREAYRDAGYKAKDAAADTNASRLLKNAEVAARVDELKDDVAKAVKVTATRVFDELVKIGFSNMGDYLEGAEDGEPRLNFTKLTRAQKAALQEVTVETRTGYEGSGDDRVAVPVRKVKFKLYDKRAALVDLGKHFGLFSGKIDDPNKDKGGADRRPLTDLEAARRIAFVLAAAEHAAPAPAAPEQPAPAKDAPNGQ